MRVCLMSDFKTMLKPLCHESNEQLGYLQALDDFGITELLAKLSNYCHQEEQESLAAVLIQTKLCITASSTRFAGKFLI